MRSTRASRQHSSTGKAFSSGSGSGRQLLASFDFLLELVCSGENRLAQIFTSTIPRSSSEPACRRPLRWAGIRGGSSKLAGSYRAFRGIDLRAAVSRGSIAGARKGAAEISRGDFLVKISLLDHENPRCSMASSLIHRVRHVVHFRIVSLKPGRA